VYSSKTTYIFPSFTNGFGYLFRDQHSDIKIATSDKMKFF